MMTNGEHTFPKSEKLCGKTTIASLMEGGKWGSSAHLRYCWLKRDSEEAQPNRLVISVPKKYFKRAVKRNLLKRRVREAYRLNKGTLCPSNIDMLLVWTSAEVAEFSVIAEEVTSILQRIASKI